MDDQVWGELPDDLPDELTGEPSDDADTGDLDGYDPLGEQVDGGLDGGLDGGDAADGGPETGAEPAAHGRLGSLDEPLGTESATDDFDAAVAETTELDGPTAFDTSDDSTTETAAAPTGSEALFGSDPDALPPATGDGDDGHDFPPDLTDLAGVPEPVDGPPWSDPTVLGADAGPGTGSDAGPVAALTSDAAPDPADLAAYDGSEPPAGGDVWDRLLNSDDPATSALAQWWAPGR